MIVIVAFFSFRFVDFGETRLVCFDLCKCAILSIHTKKIILGVLKMRSQPG